MTKKLSSSDHTAAYAEDFYIGNLLFVGVFYLALWILYFLRYERSSAIKGLDFSYPLIGRLLDEPEAV
ncbi:MAG: hypothetical protein IMF15_06730 [Proteobacteria bacterium]|nr:hypothetical protein [Pseudomonadota bacterium]